MLNRRHFLKAIGAGSVMMTLVGEFSCRKTSPKPNVILIVTDDQGYGDLGCHGNPIVRTPNMDMLHAESVRLTNFHVGPTCAPTRASLMTGRYCNRTGVWHTVMGRSLLREDEVTMADVFWSAGYQTALFGKWHLGDNYPFRPQDRGFDESLIHGGGGVTQTPDYWDNDYFDDTYFRNGQPVKVKGYCTDVWFDYALKFIEKNADKPFFCMITTNAPHGPYHVAEKYSEPYAQQGLTAQRSRFYGMITNIDENLARLDTHLKTLGLFDHTITIFMTDNGTAAGADVDAHGFVTDGYNAGMRGKKGSEYDGGHRVPCFIRWPSGGIGGGNDVTRLTAHIDILPTLMDLCAIPRTPEHQMDGKSLVPLLTQPQAEWPERFLVTDSQRIEHPEKWRKSAVMTDRWRLINGSELYDIQTDPGQVLDIASENEAIVRQLRAAYESWWSDVSKRFHEYCHIRIGAEQENPVRLTAHDWHHFPMPWNQALIRQGHLSNGFWAVDIVRDGPYEFTLRRWPRELNNGINQGLQAKSGIPGIDDMPPGKVFNIFKGKIKIADIEKEQALKADARELVFTLTLKKGKTTLKTWFFDAGGDTLGAYYVYVKKL
ncbi:N-acetylgalactosamine-4-sulfatase [candidate division KSB1 bacterium]|nr:arylsulfatase [candidate division KSB1 bacterium]RQW06911.1 MAG: N-acetylgalactosamine-4-sulfatase [candidate division KSB1 bacterium]